MKTYPHLLGVDHDPPTVVGHGEDGDLGDGPAAPFNSARPLIDGCQVCVHVSGETSATRDLLSGCRHLGGGVEVTCTSCSRIGGGRRTGLTSRSASA